MQKRAGEPVNRRAKMSSTAVTPGIPIICTSPPEKTDSMPIESLESPQPRSRRSSFLDESHTPKQLKVLHNDVMRNISASDLIHELTESRDTLPHVVEQAASLPEARVLVLYTGGTIGMKTQEGGVYSPVAGYLPEVLCDIPPLNDKAYIEKMYPALSVRPYALPPVRHMQKRVVYWIVEYDPLLDSCDMTFDDWIRIASDIRKAYQNYDGFVVLHGTDTLAYTASALSFMMENLGKPVIITGSQIPVAEVRSDGMENLIGALITAGNFDIPEVCVYFNNKLMRGNRTIKLDNSALEAFDSPNMPPLAQMAINIKVHYSSIFRSDCIAPFYVHDNLCRDVGMLRIFPSMSIESPGAVWFESPSPSILCADEGSLLLQVRAFLQPPTKGVILQTFGAGNMPTKRADIIQALKEAIDRGCLIVNCSQCLKGQVDVNYVTGKILYDIGVIPGSDMTSEAAMAKLCYVIGKDEWDHDTKRLMLQTNLRGEMTVTMHDEKMRELDIIPHIARCMRISSAHEVQLLRDTILPPLFCNAAKQNDTKLLKNLVEAGVNFSILDYNLRTALHVAASNGNLESVIYLLSIGTSVHMKDIFGYNAILCAVKAKSIECVEAIRRAGGSVDLSEKKIGVDLCLAAAQGDFHLLQCYHAAGCSMKETDYDNRSALHVAVVQNRLEIVEFLLESDADPEAIDDFGRTPLHEAQERKHDSILKLLELYMRPTIKA
ncbi:hypothetical protein WR25_09154 [Diploscapter pachys]|uniref:asparaginase n=1 Tax=Diploscapter pachys TaxID=2018661 RepID=A0A2A2LIF3_9BILA|nr:hypothetical protein WR25_09154 [Diploscapter pachys]